MTQNERITLFFSHALNEGDRGTELMRLRFREEVSEGKDWQCGVDFEQYPTFLWLKFKVLPTEQMKDLGFTTSSQVNFYALPMTGKAWFTRERHPEGLNLDHLKKAVTYAARDARIETFNHKKLGWGAYTKLTTGHGAKFLFEGHLNDSLDGHEVWTTHGDAGTAAMVFESLRLSGVGKGDTLSIVGAYGVIGAALARHAFSLGIKSLVLIGNKDKPGKTDKQEKLEQLKSQITTLFPDRAADIHLYQDTQKAHDEKRPSIIVVATSGSEFSSDMFPSSSVIYDLTTPRALREEMNWGDRLVLTAGSAVFSDPAILPNKFDEKYGWTDIGAGGEFAVWGCFAETIVRSLFESENHVIGTDVQKDDFDWCLKHFPLVGLEPSLPDMFGEKLSWNFVRERLKKSRA